MFHFVNAPLVFSFIVSYNIAAMIKRRIVEFLEYLETKKRRASRTVRNYDLYLKRFRSFADAKKVIDVSDITSDAIAKYQAWLRAFVVDKKQIKSNTINYHLIALRAFLKYLVHKKLLFLSPAKVRLNRHERGVMVCLCKPEMEKLLKAPFQFASDKIIQMRDLAILELLFCTGMKVSELAGLKKPDINVGKRQVVVHRGEEKERAIAITNQAAYSVTQYLNARRDDVPALFIGHDRTLVSRKTKKSLGALTGRSIERIVEKYARLCGINIRVTPQVIRNTFAARQVKRGTLQEGLQSELGCLSANTAKRFFE